MNTRLLISISGLLLIYGCSKSADELFEISNENLKNDETDKAITGYEKLLYKYPEDTLASQVQYKLATLHLNWKNDLPAGYSAVEATVSNYGGDSYKDYSRISSSSKSLWSEIFLSNKNNLLENIRNKLL